MEAARRDCSSKATPMADVAPFLKKIFAAKKNDCSGFFKGVLSELGTASFNLTDSELAGQGYLVVARLKAQDHQPKKGKDGLCHPYTHGHITIVQRGPTNKDGYPYVICGSNNPDTTHEYGRSDGSRAVNEYVWRQVDAPNVKYYRFVTKFPKLITN
jgi:hypothetical protein